MKYINLTEHSINVMKEENFADLIVKGSSRTATGVIDQSQVFVIESSGIARVAMTTEVDGSLFSPVIEEIPLFRSHYGELNIDEIFKEIKVDSVDVIIVSAMCVAAAKAQDYALATQMVSPYGVVRDVLNTSNVLGCTGFTR